MILFDFYSVIGIGAIKSFGVDTVRRFYRDNDNDKG